MSESTPPVSEPKGERVCASVNYLGPNGPGFGTLTEISKRGARLSNASVGVSPGDKLHLSFRFFETSNPVKIQVLVGKDDHSEKKFSVSFRNIDPLVKRSLIAILQQLRQRGAGEICRGALLDNR